MATSFGALCTDFYINQKLAMKLELPRDRETVLHFFDRMKRSMPEMRKFRHYEGELALESARLDARYKWLALCKNQIRAGQVNPETMKEAYDYHKLIMELSPHFLTLSPLDIDYVEVLFGFDLECERNHDDVIYEALYTGSPLAELLYSEHGKVMDVQPSLGGTLTERGDLQVYYEIKSRQKSRRGSSQAFRDQPLSVFLTMRKYEPVGDVRDLGKVFSELCGYGEQLAMDKLVPHVIQPISQYITTGGHDSGPDHGGGMYQ
ncbi:hypothetical protein KS4_00890 [Poriferisphaera corsica]|uniref:Uncharacterized protein n=1 Tax=Poriferisphaera corsica TaxID=2528020 RepID=A0A517YPA9_9BACT|nr:hypothetical protein [Poriferisphaera corsica]QDU32060.1 hypothetical protein KS4_00890 [Poriferisphaera corsica]